MRVGPRRISSAIEQQAHDVVVAELDGGGEWAPAIRPRFRNARRIRVKNLRNAVDVAQSSGRRKVVGGAS
jgi:hypothetical protein